MTKQIPTKLSLKATASLQESILRDLVEPDRSIAGIINEEDEDDTHENQELRNLPSTPDPQGTEDTP
jgi:hypothetical protein